MAGARLIEPAISTTTARRSQLLLDQSDEQYAAAVADNELVEASEDDVSSTSQRIQPTGFKVPKSIKSKSGGLLNASQHGISGIYMNMIINKQNRLRDQQQLE